jgi:hypothetical protein
MVSAATQDAVFQRSCPPGGPLAVLAGTPPSRPLQPAQADISWLYAPHSDGFLIYINSLTFPLSGNRQELASDLITDYDSVIKSANRTMAIYTGSDAPSPPGELSWIVPLTRFQ